MKKLLFLLLLAAFSFTVKAQVINLKSTIGNNTDTVANTATEVLSSGAIAGKVSAFTVAVTITKISGTVDGSLRLQYSLDGTSYFSVAADSVYTPTDVSSQVFGWLVKCPAPVKYIRVSYTGTGTMSAILAAKAWGN
jgi:hypothetical protein